MKNLLLLVVIGGAVVSAFGEETTVEPASKVNPAFQKLGVLPRYARFPNQPLPNALVNPLTVTSTELPMWTYSVTAGADLGGGSYTGTILGRSPYLPGKTTTTIPLQIVPVKIIINNGGGDTHTYDPLINDGCAPAGHTAVDLVENSPIFQPTTWTMDGVNVSGTINGGKTQYHDAFTRASFWSLVGGTSYHLVENVTTLPEQTLYFGSVGNAGSTSGAGTNYNLPVDYPGDGFCGYLGVLYVNDLVTAVNNTLAALSPTVNIGTLPMILVDSVVSGETGASVNDECCVLGFHSNYGSIPDLQVTSIFDLDYSGAFGNNDVTVISHELGEAIFDPTGVNATPVWGEIGQTAPSTCQNNLEVGDPLSPGFGTATNEWSVVSPVNGLTYHLQELTFFSWFFGGTDLGIAGYYSDNGTFTHDSAFYGGACTSDNF
jgi:hypothetical protein